LGKFVDFRNSKFKINYSARLVARGVRHQGICKFEISPQKERRNGEAIPPLKSRAGTTALSQPK
jgi:hypothetical protein